MGNKMLIDATHPEETRVVVLRGNRVEEFDYESAARKQLRGNIYLAKVTRVEPSLQAAFVDYGGNRHGFLAFSEIHPDYYQIPVAERQALLEEQAQGRARRAARQAAQAASATGEEAEFAVDDHAPEGHVVDDAHFEPDHDHHDLDAPHDALDEIETVGGATPALPDESEHDHEHAHAGEHDVEGRDRDGRSHEDDGKDGPSVHMVALESILPPRLSEELSAAIARAAEAADEIPIEGEDDPNDAAADEPTGAEDDQSVPVLEESDNGDADDHSQDENSAANGGENGDAAGFESVGSEDALEELPQRSKPRRRYKIQEVIRRRQILLVQVVKEERGNKGAALTTYLSLAGRYTVLMPNTDTGGGISRKITQPVDRKRLKEIANELEVPEGMGLIIRTAGASRTKAEIKRDFEYLLRLWENVRDLTLKSTAPALVYEEGNIIKRAIRDLYNKDIDEISVAGEDAYREAKDFMRMLMPSHAKNVQPYREPEPLFIRYEVERQLNAMFSPYVTLRSGGYIVINQTEALVAIDVNSGKATREHSIEDTALRTNSEAAEEIARQLRLRDLAGLIVIDFIDMEEKRNNRSVERRLKDCLRNDRARIQVGHISHFGLLEMSRQRLRTGVLEGSTSQCQMCQGTGVVRSTESVALWVLRTLEDTLRTDGPCHLSATTSVDVALYILNHKRNYLRDIEARYGVSLTVTASERMHGANFNIEKASGPIVEAPPARVVQMDWTQMEDEDLEAVEPEFDAENDVEDDVRAEEETGSDRVSRRRRRRRRGREDREARMEARTRQDGRSRNDGRPQNDRSESQPPAPYERFENGESDSEAHDFAQDSGPSEDESRAVIEPHDDHLAEDGENAERPKRSRRRGRRGGRRQRSLRQMHEAAANPLAGEDAELAASMAPSYDASTPEGDLEDGGFPSHASEQEVTTTVVVQTEAPAPVEAAPAPHEPSGRAVEVAAVAVLEVVNQDAAGSDSAAVGEPERRAALAVVEAPGLGEQPSVSWSAPETQPTPPMQSQPLGAGEQSTSVSPAARAERLRRRRKGWWQRRSNG